MKTQKLKNGNTKVWFNREAEFKIINKTAPLIDTLIEANLIQRNFSKILVEDIKKAGFDEIHGVLLDIDDMLQSQMDTLEVSELDEVFDSFNSIFHTNYKYHKSSNGITSITLAHFDNYQEFVKDYFGSFLLKLYAGKIDIVKSEKETSSLKGLTKFIEAITPDYMKLYLKTSSYMNFFWVINIVI
jgi:hypothetical protein